MWNTQLRNSKCLTFFCFLFLSKRAQKIKHFHMILFMFGLDLAPSSTPKQQQKKNIIFQILKNSFISYSTRELLSQLLLLFFSSVSRCSCNWTWANCNLKLKTNCCLRSTKNKNNNNYCSTRIKFEIFCFYFLVLLLLPWSFRTFLSCRS